jgi:hypothetical protein
VEKPSVKRSYTGASIASASAPLFRSRLIVAETSQYSACFRIGD